MTDLRTAAQQALEALEDMLGWQSLAPQTIQEAAKGRAYALRAALAEPVQQGCDHCNHPLYAATKCRVCGRVTEPAPPQRKPLSDADLAKIWDDALDQLDPRDQLRFVARAVERAHGIGEQR